MVCSGGELDLVTLNGSGFTPVEGGHSLQDDEVISWHLTGHLFDMQHICLRLPPVTGI
jgi:hypothetical protein